VTGRRGRRHKGLLEDIKKRILETERGSNRSHSVGNSLSQKRRTCHKKVIVYLSSLMMKVPDHVYVLGDTYTCNMFKNITDTHNNNTIITCATAVCFCFYLSSPTPSANRSHTRAYVTRMKDNVSRSVEPRHVIPDTRISSGQYPRCDVNVKLGARDLHAVREIFKVTRN
jgi:hypothetical protein